MKTRLLIAATSIAALCSASHASLLYTFDYDRLDFDGNSYSAASITFSRSTFAASVGDVLTYVSGDINGCAPASIAFHGINAFVTPIFAIGSCGDGTGPDVDGLFFRPDLMPPLTTGTFVSSGDAGRQFELVGGATLYQYVGGSLTIRDTGTVPEPGSLALAGLGLAMAAGRSWRRNRRG
ncbi:PEP-CTERM sorting domain-containing protein [Accumulibacter sp.]|uniref:PEP-CTERM sorting domain-containing protein n=1 Tax=Accumulibacter sp. TaxID=2053492 RepID=UPI0026129F3E|nr:PEP-CTERM sorting domain-containing protein [Accumulibacter sp.]